MSQFVCDYHGVHEIPEIQNSTFRNPDPWLIESIAGPQSESGIRVTPGKILSHAPIWQGINIIAGDCGMLPKMLKKRLKDGGSEDNRTHNAFRLVAQIANPLMQSQIFWETMFMRAIVYGNGIAEIARDAAGRPLPADQGGLTPLLPEKTFPFYDENGKFWIETRIQVNGHQEPRFIDPIDTIHIKGLSGDGIWGLSLRQVAQDSIGYGLALRKHGNTVFKNRARPDMLLHHPDRLSDEGKAFLRESWAGLHQGLDNTARIAILEEGMTATPFTQSNEDAQWIEAQKFDVDNSSRLLNIPPHMLGSMDRATFSNIEEQGRNYINRTLNRWLMKMTWECWWKLLSRLERERFFFAVNVDMLLKGTLKDRAAAYNQLIASTILNPNEVREEEGWNPREGGDVYKNPNTSTNKQQTEQPPEPPADDTEERLRRVEERNAKMLADRLQAIVHNEDSAVIRAASSETNFVTWLDDFYQTVWPRRLSELVDCDVASTYCEDRHGHWLEVSGNVGSTEALSDAVTRGRADSRDRGVQLLNLELNPERNGYKAAA